MTAISSLALDCAVEIVELLRVRPLRKAHLASDLDASGQTIQRALTWLRHECAAPIIHDRKIGR